MDNIITGIPHEGHFAATMEGMAQATAFLDEICPNPKLSIVFDEIASNVVRCSGATSFDVKVSRGRAADVRFVSMLGAERALAGDVVRVSHNPVYLVGSAPLDGVAVAEKNYTAESGSTIIRFKQEFIK